MTPDECVSLHLATSLNEFSGGRKFAGGGSIAAGLKYNLSGQLDDVSVSLVRCCHLISTQTTPQNELLACISENSHLRTSQAYREHHSKFTVVRLMKPTAVGFISLTTVSKLYSSLKIMDSADGPGDTVILISMG